MAFGRIKALFVSEFLRNVLTLMTGTGLAAVITLCASPFLTRIFSPSEFGVFSSYASVVAIIAAVSAGRYDVTIVLPRDNKQAYNLMALSFSIVCLTSALSFISLLFINNSAFEFAGLAVVAPYKYGIPVMIFCAGCFLIMMSYANRIKAYADLAFGKIIDASILNIGGVAFGLMGGGIWALIVTQIAGRGASAFYIVLRHWKKLRQNVGNITVNDIKAQAVHYKSFPKYSIWGSMTGALAANIHIILFLSFYGDYVVGIIALATRILGAPLQILSGSFSQVFYEKIAGVDDRVTMRRLYIQATNRLSLLACVGILIVMAIPSHWLEIVFGDEWGGVMPYIRIMVFWFAAQFVAGTVSVIYTRFLRESLILLIQIANLALTVGSIWGAYALDCSIEQALYAFVIMKLLIYIFTVIFPFRLIQTICR